MRLSMRLASAGLLVGMMTTTGLAYAGPSAQELANAEALFKQGNDLMKKQQWKEACAAFGGSNDIDPSPGTEINLALCNEKQGKLATAWGLYLTAANLADNRGQKDRADIARGEATKLEPRLHKLVVNPKTPTLEGLVVTTDGVAVKSSTYGAELPVDPGDHTIEATAKGKKPFKSTIKIAPTPGVDRVEIPALEDDPNAAPKPVVGPAPGPQPGDSNYQPPAGEQSSTKRTVGFILGGAGVVAAGVAIVLEVVAGKQSSDSDTQKANADAIKPAAGSTTLTAQQKADQAAYQKSAEDKHDAAKNDQLGAIVIGVGALALLGTGAYLIFTSPSTTSSKPATTGLQKPMLVPLLSPDTAGVGLVGRF